MLRQNKINKRGESTGSQGLCRRTTQRALLGVSPSSCKGVYSPSRNKTTEMSLGVNVTEDGVEAILRHALQCISANCPPIRTDPFRCHGASVWCRFTPIAILQGFKDPVGLRVSSLGFCCKVAVAVEGTEYPYSTSISHSTHRMLGLRSTLPATIASQRGYCRTWDDKQNEAHWCMLLSAGIDSTQSCVKPRSGSGAYEIPALIASNRRPKVQ